MLITVLVNVKVPDDADLDMVEDHIEEAINHIGDGWISVEQIEVDRESAEKEV